MRDRAGDIELIRRPLLRMAALELGSIVPMLLVWLIVGVVDLRVYVALHVPRLLFLAAYLHRQLDPVRHWLARGAEASQGDLLAADTAIQHLPSRQLAPHVIGWFLTPLLAVLAAALGFPTAHPIAGTELLTITMVLVIGVVVHPAVQWPEMRRLCDGLMAKLGPQLAAHGLVPYRPAASIARELPRLVLSLILTCVIALGAMLVQLRSNGLRAHTEAELREAVTRMAARRRAGHPLETTPLETISDGEFTIVAREQLPAALVSGPEDDVARSLFDPRADQAIAAVALGDGHYLRAAASPPEQLGLVIALALTIIAVVMVLTHFVLRSATHVLLAPLARLDEATRVMVETGQLRALARVTPTRRDEIGSLVANFNAMLDMLDELAGGAQAVAAGDLRVALERPGELHDAFRAMLAQLHDMVERLRATALEVSSASAEIHASMQQHESAALQHNAHVDQLSHTTQSLAAAAGQINDVAANVLRDAERSLVTVDTVFDRTAELGSQTGGIRELLELIREIADRSDLLALNGSLEATRAGEAGRGFMLVAAEMRRLAERVTGTVADVRARVAAIESASTNTAEATALGRKLTQDTAAAARAISKLTRKQSDDTGQASTAAQAMATFVLSSSTTTSQTRAATEGLRAQVEALERLTREFKLRGE